MKDEEKNIQSLSDALSAADVMFRQIRELVPPGMAYYSVRLPDGSAAQFPDEESALKFAAKSGGAVIAHPTRAALRILGAAANATTVATHTSVVFHPGYGIEISNEYMTILIIFRSDGEWTVVATTAVGVGDRVTPGIGAASTDEWARDRRGEQSFGRRAANATMIAVTRALNRGFEDVTGLVTLGAKQVPQQESPQATVIKTARSLGIPVTDIRRITGFSLAQVSGDNVEDIITALRNYASGSDRSTGEGTTTQQGAEMGEK